MIPNNGIHRISSCKINLDLGGGSYIPNIFTNIDFKDDFFGIQLILILLGDMLEFVIGLTLFPIKAL